MNPITDKEWDMLFDKTDDAITKVVSELPPDVQTKADSIECVMDRYDPDGHHVLGRYLSFQGGVGPIIVYVGQIFDDCHHDFDAAMQSVRQVYLHELTHALGCNEIEVREKGL